MSSLDLHFWVHFMNRTDYRVPLYEGNLYHIYNRGNGKEKIFFSEENYYYFLRRYEKYTFNHVETFAYCLLPNHFHLLIRIKNNDPETISENFRKFFISYSMSVNEREKRRGNLFQRGFKRKLIENERYFYTAVYYIHCNPVHHHIVTDLKKYKFSSYNKLIGSDKTILRRDEVMEWFGGRGNFIDYHSQMKDRNFSDEYLIEEDI